MSPNHELIHESTDHLAAISGSEGNIMSHVGKPTASSPSSSGNGKGKNQKSSFKNSKSCHREECVCVSSIVVTFLLRLLPLVFGRHKSESSQWKYAQSRSGSLRKHELRQSNVCSHKNLEAMESSQDPEKFKELAQGYKAASETTYGTCNKGVGWNLTAPSIVNIDAQFADHYNWFAFRPGKTSHRNQLYSQAYIQLRRPEDVFEFADFFDGHVFVSQKEVQLEKKEVERSGTTKDNVIVTPLMEYVQQKQVAKGADVLSHASNSSIHWTVNHGGAQSNHTISQPFALATRKMDSTGVRRTDDIAVGSAEGISMQVKGTLGYLDPQYFMTIQPTDKTCLQLWGCDGGNSENMESMTGIANLGEACLNIDIDKMPSMKDVIQELPWISNMRRLDHAWLPHVIFSHSERSLLLKEASEVVADKVVYALSQGLKVIGCVGESLLSSKKKEISLNKPQ
eukprot:Gb_26872 [translate_table: standard]